MLHKRTGRPLACDLPAPLFYFLGVGGEAGEPIGQGGFKGHKGDGGLYGVGAQQDVEGLWGYRGCQGIGG